MKVDFLDCHRASRVYARHVPCAQVF